MISITNFSKSYADHEVLRDINVQINQGEVISIIGPSGSGKSTFLRCLNLLEQPSSGQIKIDDIDLLAKNCDITKMRQKMNMVFQSFNLFAHLSTLENLTIGPIKLRGMCPQLAEDKARQTLKLVGLAEKADSYPDELSGGQKQRVAIARCLAMEPEIILFDEPTSALDPTMISEVLSVIRRLAHQGITMLIVTHEMDFAQDVSNRVFYMDEGTIYEQGTPQQIFENPQKDKTKKFIHRIRDFKYQITSADYDLYAMNAKIESFCEKHHFSVAISRKILLLTEEVLQLFQPYLADMPLQTTIAYSEKHNTIQLFFSCSGKEINPLDTDIVPDEIGLMLIENLADSIENNFDGHKNTLTMMLKMDHSDK